MKKISAPAQEDKIAALLDKHEQIILSHKDYVDTNEDGLFPLQVANEGHSLESVFIQTPHQVWKKGQFGKYEDWVFPIWKVSGISATCYNNQYSLIGAVMRCERPTTLWNSFDVKYSSKLYVLLKMYLHTVQVWRMTERGTDYLTTSPHGKKPFEHSNHMAQEIDRMRESLVDVTLGIYVIPRIVVDMMKLIAPNVQFDLDEVI